MRGFFAALRMTSGKNYGAYFRLGTLAGEMVADDRQGEGDDGEE
jgi:hypothetical protein